MQVISTALTPFNPGQAKRFSNKAQVAKRSKSQANTQQKSQKKAVSQAGDWIEAEWSEWQDESEESHGLAPWLLYKKVQNALVQHQPMIDFYA